MPLLARLPPQFTPAGVTDGVLDGVAHSTLMKVSASVQGAELIEADAGPRDYHMLQFGRCVTHSAAISPATAAANRWKSATGARPADIESSLRRMVVRAQRGQTPHERIRRHRHPPPTQ